MIHNGTQNKQKILESSLSLNIDLRYIPYEICYVRHPLQ